MKVPSCILLALCLIASKTAAPQASEEQIERLFRAGQQTLQQGQFATAADNFTKVLALDPTLIEAEVNLGLAYQGLLQYDSATRHLTKALRQRPDLLGPTVIVGMDYLKLGLPDKGIPFLQHALKLDASNRDAREALASSYLNQENFQNAAEQFRQIALLDSDKSEAWFKLGHQYLNLAARLAYRAAHLYRESAWGHRFLGDLLFQREHWDETVKEYQKALVIEPQQLGLHTSLGETYLHKQELEEADAQFHQEAQLDPRNELAWLGLANTQLAGSHPVAALNSIAKAWDASPEFLSVQRDFPSIELTQDLAKAAISILYNEPDTPAKHFLLFGLFSAADESESEAREWKSFQNYVSAWQQTAKSADPCQAHHYTLCIGSLESRSSLKDSERLQLGKAHFALQQYDSASDALAQVHGASPENAEASYWLQRTYQAQATQTYARLEEDSPQSWRTHQLRAEGYALRGSLADALKEFQAALDLRPKEPELHEALGELYLDHSQKDDAQRELEQTLMLDPARTHALYLLGLLYVEEKENEKAVPYLERAVRLQPDLAEANSLLGTAYLRLGQLANAITKLEKAAGSDHYGNVHYQLSVAYRKLGQPERAKKELAQSQDLRRSYLARDEALIMGSPQPEAEPH